MRVGALGCGHFLKLEKLFHSGYSSSLCTFFSFKIVFFYYQCVIFLFAVLRGNQVFYGITIYFVLVQQTTCMLVLFQIITHFCGTNDTRPLCNWLPLGF